METEIFHGGIQVKEFKEAHAVFEDGSFADPVFLKLRTNAEVFGRAATALDWLGKLLDGSLVKDGSESAVGNVERDDITISDCRAARGR